MKAIYALLVGIDSYNPPVPKLSGAKKDIEKIKTYLEKNFNDRPLHIKTLLEQEATYDQFIQNFRDHLGQAKADDVVWFHYSGHGSRQTSAEEFEKLNSGKKDETLVLYDSRPSGKDLADKELAILIHEIGARGPHILVTLDCCHSGSGTRSAEAFTERLSADRGDKRTIDTYLNGYFNQRGTTLPEARYLFFAACNRFQSAKESFDGGGLFTENLIQTLEKSKKDISYADLLIRLRQGVVSMKWDQDPQMEVVGDLSSYTQFLDGSVVKGAPKYAVRHDEEGWAMEAGQILGITEEVKLAIYPDQSNELLGAAIVNQSSAQISRISTETALDPEAKYWAVPLNIPGIPFKTGLNVDEHFREAFVAEAERFLNVRFNIPGNENDPYSLIQKEGYFELINHENGLTILRADIKFKQAIHELVRKLDQIATWTRFLKLQNNKTALNPDCCSLSVDIEVSPGRMQNFPRGEIRLKSDGSRIPYKLWIQNQFTQPLHFALIYLSDHYGSVPIKNEPLEKSDQPTLFWGGTENDVFMLPEGSVSSKDSFLIIISTERTDDFQFTLEEMEFGDLKFDDRAIPGMNRSTKVKGEWFTSRFMVILER